MALTDSCNNLPVLVKREQKAKENPYGKKYDPEVHIPLLYQIFSLGQGINAFCAYADISVSTFNRWRRENSGFKEAFEIALPKAARIWEDLPLQAMEKDLKFSYPHWALVMRHRGYLKNDNFESDIDDALKSSGETEDKLGFMWRQYVTGAISSDEYSKVVSAITGGLRAKELEVAAKELELKAQELEYQKSTVELSQIPDEAIEAYMLVKSGKAKVVKNSDNEG